MKQVNAVPDRAATLVVHPTPGIGDATTIQEAVDMIVGSGFAGGEIFLREGTYALTTTVTLPDLPISIIGCGEASLISLGANAIPAFTIPDGLTQYRQYVFKNFNVLGTNVANQRIVSVQDTSAFGQVNMSLVKSEGVQIAIDIPNGDTTFTRQVQIVTEDCWFIPIPANTGSILHVANAFFQVEWKADRIRFIDLESPFGSPGVQGGSLVLHNTPGVFINVEAWIVDSIFNITLDSTFGSVYFENCSFVNLTTNLIFMYILGSLTLLGHTALINCHAENNINFNFNEEANVVGGKYQDCVLVLFGDPSGTVTGVHFTLGPESSVNIDTASRTVLVDGCFFEEDAAVTGGQYIDMSVSSPGINSVTNCMFEALSAGSNTAVKISVTSPGTRTAVISGNFFDQPNVPPTKEIASTDNVIYANNWFSPATLAQTIVGANSRVDGVQAGDARGAGSIAFGWGRLTSVFTDAGNAGAGTSDLQSYSVPANTLNTTGRTIRVKAWGRTANNANAKTVTLEFGGQTIMTQALTASIAGTWRIDAEIVKNGASTQRIFAELLQLATLVQKQTATAGVQTDTAAIIIKCTGTGVVANDVVQEGLIVEIS